MPDTPSNTPCILIIRDGWGQNPNPEHDPFNAIKLARTPVDDRLMRECPHALIKTSSVDVGLPEGTMGNSEVGHQNIGAGRIVDQDSVRITKASRDGTLTDSDALVGAINAAKQRDRYVHLLCICSDAGVHGLLEHLYAVVKLCKQLDHNRVAIHLFTDGRDTGPFTGKGYIEQVEQAIKQIGVGRIASIIGRYWAMDRDHRWHRVEKAYNCLTGRCGQISEIPFASIPTEAAQDYYDAPLSPSMKGDEFITPTMIGANLDSARATRITDGDSVIFCNYRGDRPREILSAFVVPDEQWKFVKPSPETGTRGFKRGPKIKLHFVTMASYSEELSKYVNVAFPKPPKMQNIFADHLSTLGLNQFRCAETEKFPHVTFFFNDYREEPFEGEHREICPSPRDVQTYDQKPEMSAADVRDAVLSRLDADDCEPVIIVNFANADMVGHTGSLDAVVQACEVVDACVGAIIDKALARGGSLIVTADHGNAEQMWNPESDAPHTAHTTYDVPLIIVGKAFADRTLRTNGRLSDIAPTMLDMMGIQQPTPMTGRSLLI